MYLKEVVYVPFWVRIVDSASLLDAAYFGAQTMSHDGELHGIAIVRGRSTSKLLTVEFESISVTFDGAPPLELGVHSTTSILRPRIIIAVVIEV